MHAGTRCQKRPSGRCKHLEPAHEIAEVRGADAQVDQFWGSNPQQLRDRVWLHAVDDTPESGAGGVTAVRGERAAAQAQPLPSAVLG